MFFTIEKCQRPFMHIPAFQVYQYNRWYQGHLVLEEQNHKMSSTNTAGRRSNVRIPSILIKHQVHSLWVHCIEPFCYSKDSRFISSVLLKHPPWGMGHRESGLKRVNKADRKQLRDLSGYYERGQVPTCHLYQYPLFVFVFVFPEKQECELVKILRIFSLHNLCLIFSFTSGTSIMDPSGPVYISTSVPLSVLKLFCLTQNFNPTVQQGQRESASELRRLMLQWMGENAQGDCCPSMRILSCRLSSPSIANKVYGLQWRVCGIKVSLFYSIFPFKPCTGSILDWAPKVRLTSFQFSLLIACLS